MPNRTMRKKARAEHQGRLAKSKEKKIELPKRIRLDQVPGTQQYTSRPTGIGQVEWPAKKPQRWALMEGEHLRLHRWIQAATEAEAVFKSTKLVDVNELYNAALYVSTHKRMEGEGENAEGHTVFTLVKAF